MFALLIMASPGPFLLDRARLPDFCHCLARRGAGSTMVMSAHYAGQTSFFGDNTPLPLESGYAIILGFGAFFSVLTTILVYLDKYANGTEHTSEFFNTAGRSVKTGLTASVIVSQWTWAATLLQSSNVAWNYGVSGPFWYASGATIQVTWRLWWPNRGLALG